MFKYNKSGQTCCGRCWKPSVSLGMSRFNTQMICIECEDKEKAHPQYKEAKDAELQAVKSGNMNFKGIGKPFSL